VLALSQIGDGLCWTGIRRLSRVIDSLMATRAAMRSLDTDARFSSGDGINAFHKLLALTQRITQTRPNRSVRMTTYTRADGTTSTVADATFALDPIGYVVAQTVTFDAGGSTTIDNKAYNTDGSLANETITTTSADGKSIMLSASQALHFRAQSLYCAAS
jgi:hypothetical protein